MTERGKEGRHIAEQIFGPMERLGHEFEKLWDENAEYLYSDITASPYYAGQSSVLADPDNFARHVASRYDSGAMPEQAAKIVGGKDE